MSLQYISDATGAKTAVVLPIDEWDKLKQAYPGIGSVETEIPHWQKETLNSRRGLVSQHGELMNIDDFLREMEQEANDEV